MVQADLSAVLSGTILREKCTMTQCIAQIEETLPGLYGKGTWHLAADGAE